MTRDICHYYEKDIKSVYAAYIDAIKQGLKKGCQEYPYYKICFSLGFSIKYNMNGGACTFHFIPYGNGTAVNVRYSIVQAFGAKYEAHDKNFTNLVVNILKVEAQNIQIPIEEFLNSSNQVEYKYPTQKNTNKVDSQISTTEELKKYKELLDTGVITTDEFDKKKKQLLNL